MMNFNCNIKSLLTVILITVPIGAAGQAITIIGSGGDARNCSMAANNAAKFGFVSREDLDTCTRALEYGRLKRSDLAGTYVNRGIVQTALGRHQDAFSDYHHAMELQLGLPEAYVGRGNIYFLAGKYDRAIEDYTRALDLNIGRDYIAHLNRGMAYEKVGNYDDAEANYRRALELQPEWQLALDKLNRLLAKHQE
jgi:tetratricopeptide (TPR) repeat protein